MPKKLASALLCLGTLSVACESTRDSSTQSLSTVRDSAGITIIENERPSPDSRLGWKVSATPTLSIGLVEGDPNYEFFQVAGARKLSDGRIMVANSGSNELKLFDFDGTYLGAWGGSGEGPGEFGASSPDGLHLWPGDSVMGSGSFQGRVSLFDSEGTHGRTFNLADGFQRLVAVVPDGSTTKMVATNLFVFGPPTEDGRMSLQRQNMTYAKLNADGSLLDTLVVHPGSDLFVLWDAERASLRVRRHPFSRSISETVWGSLIVISPNDRYEILAYRADGSLARIVRREHQRRRPTKAEFHDYFAHHYATQSDEEREESLAALEDMALLESLPAFDQVVADNVGYLWVSEYVLPSEEDSGIWTVFDAEGRVRGLVEVPDNTVLEIGADYILGTTRDEFGVEYVQLWALARGM